MLTLVLYIGSLPNLATWFPCGRGRTLFILGSLPLYRLIIYTDGRILWCTHFLFYLDNEGQRFRSWRAASILWAKGKASECCRAAIILWAVQKPSRCWSTKLYNYWLSISINIGIYQFWKYDIHLHLWSLWITLNIISLNIYILSYQKSIIV